MQRQTASHKHANSANGWVSDTATNKIAVAVADNTNTGHHIDRSNDQQLGIAART